MIVQVPIALKKDNELFVDNQLKIEVHLRQWVEPKIWVPLKRFPNERKSIENYAVSLNEPDHHITQVADSVSSLKRYHVKKERMVSCYMKWSTINVW